MLCYPCPRSQLSPRALWEHSSSRERSLNLRNGLSWTPTTIDHMRRIRRLVPQGDGIIAGQLRQFPEIAPYVIPAALLLLGVFTQKLIDRSGWKTRHFFVGLDLTIYFLATCLVNVLDITRSSNPPRDGISATVYLIVFALLCFFYQVTVHQDWEDEKKQGRRQTIMLCGVSNVIGVGLLYAFIRMKVEGVL